MAEALVKIKDGSLMNCNAADADGSLLATLIEALTGGSRLNVGQYGRTTHSPINYILGGGGNQIVDDHLGGIDSALGGFSLSPHALGGSDHSSATLAELNALVSNATLDDQGSSRTPLAHKDSHKSGGTDPFASTDLLEAVAKRLRTTTGPTDLLVGAVADGDILKRSGTGLVGTDSPAFKKLTVNQTAAADSVDVQDGGTQVMKIYDGGIVDFPKQSGCSAYRNAAWDMPNASWTKIPFDTEVFDIQGEFDTGTSGFTVTKAGYYLVSAAFRISDVAPDVLYSIAINVDGYNVGQGIGYAADIGTNQEIINPMVTAILYLPVDEVVYIYGYQNTGGAKAINTGLESTRVHIMKLA